MEYGTLDMTAPVREMTSAWVNSSKHFSKSFVHMYSSVAEANRAMLPDSNGDDARENGETSVVDSELPSLHYENTEWEMNRSVDSHEELAVGDVVTFSKVVTDEEVHAFAAVSGDTNRLHLDDEFAERTRFGRRIVHGTLASGLISSALARLPGMTIYLSQDLRFLKPVDIGDTLTAVVEIVEDLGDKRYRLSTVVEAEDGTKVIDGEAVVLIDDMPTAE